MSFTDAIKLSRKSVLCGHLLLRARRKALKQKNPAVAAELLQTTIFMHASAVAALAIAEKGVRS